MNRNQGAMQSIIEDYVNQKKNANPANPDRVRHVQLALDTANGLYDALDKTTGKVDALIVIDQYENNLKAKLDGFNDKDIESQITVCIIAKSRINQLA